MPLIRSSQRSDQTLQEFYTQWASEENVISSEIGHTMLLVIKHINTLFPETLIYGNTSLAHLLLSPKDHPEANWCIDIIANTHEYYIEYSMPKDKQPWDDAKVKGIAKSPEEFEKYLVRAMIESNAFTNREELENLQKTDK